MIYITEIHMNDHEPGTEHSHIGRLRWKNEQTGENGESTREELIDWIRTRGWISVHIKDDAGHDAQVEVVNAKPPYLRAQRDGKETDRLLSLPEY